MELFRWGADLPELRQEMLLPVTRSLVSTSSSSMKFSFLLNSALLAVLGFYTGCTPAKTNVERGIEEQTLYIGIGSEPERIHIWFRGDGTLRTARPV